MRMKTSSVKISNFQRISWEFTNKYWQENEALRCENPVILYHIILLLASHKQLSSNKYWTKKKCLWIFMNEQAWKRTPYFLADLFCSVLFSNFPFKISLFLSFSLFLVLFYLTKYILIRFASKIYIDICCESYHKMEFLGAPMFHWFRTFFWQAPATQSPYHKYILQRFQALL